MLRTSNHMTKKRYGNGRAHGKKRYGKKTENGAVRYGHGSGDKFGPLL